MPLRLVGMLSHKIVMDVQAFGRIECVLDTIVSCHISDMPMLQRMALFQVFLKGAWVWERH